MSFVDDAVEYLENQALPFVEDRKDRRDEYVPRTIIHADDQEKIGGPKEQVLGFEALRTLDDSEVADQDELVVLGRAGAGKSFLLLKAYEDAVSRFIAENGDCPFPLFLDCSGPNLPASNDVQEAFRNSTAGYQLYDRAVENHSHGVQLFIDEADTRIRKSRSFVGNLNKAIREVRQRAQRFEFILTTREGGWNELTSSLSKGVWSNAEVYSFPDEPIGDEYKHFIDDPDDRGRFLTLCRDRGLYDLLRFAFDGFALARRYAEKGTLPETREDFWDERINARLMKSEEREKMREAPSRSRLRHLAGLLACLQLFTDRGNWSVQEAINDLGATWMTGEKQPVTAPEVRWLLESRLFEIVSQNRYDFIHERYRDALAAAVLTNLPLRKQKMLLVAGSLNGRLRIAPPYRTVATTLATQDARFCHFLVEHEPEIAVFGSLSPLTSEERRSLVSRVFDWAERSCLIPTVEVEGVGETHESALSRHRVAEVADFLELPLQDSSRVRRLWAVTTAAKWNGSLQLNDLLLERALDEEESTRARQRAIIALERTQDPEAISEITQLLEDEDDEVRGYALHTWRRLKNPSPAEFIEKLSRPRSSPNSGGQLYMEARYYGRRLDEEQLTKSFRHLEKQYVDYIERISQNPPHLIESGSLHSSLLRGLLERAREFRTDSVPISLLITPLKDPAPSNVDGAIKELLAEVPSLWSRVLDYSLKHPEEVGLFGTSYTRLLNVLADSIPEEKIESLLPEGGNLSQNQKKLVEGIRLAKERNSSTSQVTEETEESEEAPSSDLSESEVRSRINAILSEQGNGSEPDARSILSEMWRIADRLSEGEDFQSRKIRGLEGETIEFILENLDEEEEEQVNNLLIESFEEEPTSELANSIADYYSQGNLSFSSKSIDTYLKKKVTWWDSVQSSHGVSILQKLRSQDEDQWRDSIYELLETDPDATAPLVEYLDEIGESYYLERAGQRLQAGDYKRRGDWFSLLEYYIGFTPEDFIQVLWAAFNSARVRNHLISNGSQLPESRPLGKWDLLGMLFLLMNRGDERAWFEFWDLLEAGEVPLSDHELHHLQQDLPTPDTISELKLFVKWYAEIRRQRHSTEGIGTHVNLGRAVMGRIIDFGTRESVKLVLRLTRELCEENIRIGHKLLQAEAEFLTRQIDLRSPSTLLEFILKSYYYLFQSEGDLFEVTCQAIEQVQSQFERGEGIAGFWNTNNGYEPKYEVECQDVLWQMLAPRLERYGLTEVEKEAFEGKNPADLRIDHHRRNNSPISIYLELKTARDSYDYGDLVKCVEDQLWEKYMHPHCRHGIFVMLWFSNGPKEYDPPSGFSSLKELEAEIEKAAEEVEEKHDVQIRPYTIDLSEDFRSK